MGSPSSRALFSLWLIVFSSFVWLSFWRRFNTRHFMFVSLCLVASYYYCAGLAKVLYGLNFSWVVDNHTSNLFLAAWQHGWLGWFLKEDDALAFTALLQRVDLMSAVFTVFIAEMGAILWMVLHPRVTRWWLLAAATLHVGIFAFAGVCFWKWLVLDLALWHFLRGGGAPIHAEIHRHKLVLAFAAVLLLFPMTAA